MRRAFLLALALSPLLPLSAQTQPVAAKQDAASAKQAEIRKLLRLLGAGESGVKAMKGALAAQRETNPQIPEAFFTAFEAAFTAERLEELVVPIYDKHLTAAEVKALLAFYATPEGKSFIRKQGLILEEAMLAGQKLGVQVGQEIAERLQAEGKL